MTFECSREAWLQTLIQICIIHQNTTDPTPLLQIRTCGVGQIYRSNVFLTWRFYVTTCTPQEEKPRRQRSRLCERENDWEALCARNYLGTSERKRCSSMPLQGRR